jgi:5'-nucleotidase
VQRGYISVTPIHVDLTRFQALEKVSTWVHALTDGMSGKTDGKAA